MLTVRGLSGRFHPRMDVLLPCEYGRFPPSRLDPPSSSDWSQLQKARIRIGTSP